MYRAFKSLPLVALLVAMSLVGCKPAGPPPDVLKTQREAMEKAKALEGQLQEQLKDRMKSVDEPEPK